MEPGSEPLKQHVRQHWENETCGTRYGDDGAGERAGGYSREFFERISRARYRLEPYILSFADFAAARGKQVLEIGTGAGSDFQQWVLHGAHATGVDLTEAAIDLTRRRLRLAGVADASYQLRVADAEALPFADGHFDLVYSYGVLHHTPDTRRAFAEVFRVLKPGGTAKAMVYHVPSWCGLMLWVQHGLLRGRPWRTTKDVIFHSLESPGTKAYRLREARALLGEAGFTDIQLTTRLSPGDLLEHAPSRKYQHWVYRVVWRLFPRWLVRLLGHRFGLFLLIEARKPRPVAQLHSQAA